MIGLNTTKYRPAVLLVKPRNRPFCFLAVVVQQSVWMKISENIPEGMLHDCTHLKNKKLPIAQFLVKIIHGVYKFATRRTDERMNGQHENITSLAWRRHHHHLSNKKLSCRRETARCFVSLNISLSHSRSVKVIRNDTLEKGVSPY